MNTIEQKIILDLVECVSALMSLLGGNATHEQIEGIERDTMAALAQARGYLAAIKMPSSNPPESYL